MNEHQHLLADPESGGSVNVPETFQLSKLRWWVMLVFSLLYVSNNTVWMTYSTIARTTRAFFHVTEFQVSLLTMTFLIISIVGYILASWVIQRRGLRFVVLAGAWFNCVGSWVRCIAPAVIPSSLEWAYVVVFVGQVISGLAQPCLVVCPPALTATWMGPDERTVATALSSLSMLIGMALIMAVAPALVKVPADLPGLQYGLAGLATFCLILTLIFFHEKPPTPPSASAAHERDDFAVGAKKLLTNRNYVLLIAAFGLGLGTFQGLLTDIDLIAEVGDYTEQDAGIMSFILIIVGLISSAIVSKSVDKWKKYKITLLMCGFLGACSFVFLAFIDVPGHRWEVFVCFGLIGASCVPVLPIAMEAGVETTHPVPESVTSAVQMTPPPIVGTIVVTALNFIPDQYKAWLFVGLLCTALVIFMFWQPDYTRMKFEKAASMPNMTSPAPTYGTLPQSD